MTMMITRTFRLARTSDDRSADFVCCISCSRRVAAFIQFCLSKRYCCQNMSIVSLGCANHVRDKQKVSIGSIVAHLNIMITMSYC